MSLNDVKITAYSKPVSALSNTPSQDGMTAEELKAWFDHNATDELKTAINTLVDFIVKLTDNETIKGIRINEDKVIEVTTDGESWEVTKPDKELMNTFATKLNNSTANNVVMLSADGNIADSGVKTQDIRDILNEKSTFAIKDNDATEGNMAVLDAEGNAVDSGIKLSFVEGGIVQANFAVKDENGKKGNITVLDAEGNAVDGGLKLSVVDGGLRITYDDGE